MAAGRVALMAKDGLSWLTSEQVDEDYLIENMSKMEGKLAVIHYAITSFHSNPYFYH